MHTQVKQHFFNKWPKTSVALLVFAAVATIDISLGWMLIPSGAMTVRRPHHFYHHGLKPSRRAMAHWGDVSYPLVTNSLGLRDGDTRELLFQTERYRILFMGDSFTEGVGVPFQQTFAGILEAQLKAKNVDVLNGGCIGYSPKLYYLKTKYLLDRGLKVNELVVLIDLSDIPNEVELYREFEPTKSIALRALALRLHVFKRALVCLLCGKHAGVQKKKHSRVGRKPF